MKHVKRSGRAITATPSIRFDGLLLLAAAHGALSVFDQALDHVAADVARLTAGQIAVVALLEVDADLPWCTPNILKCLSRVSLRYDKGEQMPGTSQRETGAAPVYREDTIGVMSRSTGLLRQETLELEGPPAHQ